MQAAVIDMDGVLWEGDRPLPGLIEFFAALRQRQMPFVLATNNASRTPEQYVAKLARMGVTVSPAEIFTSSMATALALRERSPKGGRVFMIGEDGLRAPLAQAGFNFQDELLLSVDQTNALIQGLRDVARRFMELDRQNRLDPHLSSWLHLRLTALLTPVAVLQFDPKLIHDPAVQVAEPYA